MNRSDLVKRVKLNTDNRVYLDVVALLEFELETIKRQLIKSDGDETLKLQGAGRHVSNLLTDLKRKPIERKEFKQGGFSN